MKGCTASLSTPPAGAALEGVGPSAAGPGTASPLCAPLPAPAPEPCTEMHTGGRAPP